MTRSELRVSRRVSAERLEPADCALGSLSADRNRLVGLVECRRAEVAEFRSDQDIRRTERTELAIDSILRQRADDLVENRQRVRQVFAFRDRRADVDDDQAIGAHRARDADRNIVEDAAIDEQIVVHRQRRECAGHGHARTDRQHEIAFVPDDRLAAENVGGDRAKRNRQVVEVVDLPRRCEQLAQQDQQLLALYQPLRRDDAAIAITDLVVEQEFQVLVLAPHVQFLARRIVGEHFLPVDLAEDAFDFLGTVSGRVHAADDGALCWCRQPCRSECARVSSTLSTPMCAAASATAAEHESDAIVCARVGERGACQTRERPGECVPEDRSGSIGHPHLRLRSVPQRKSRPIIGSFFASRAPHRGTRRASGNPQPLSRRWLVTGPWF
jgi:hypothetical protein